MKIKVLSRKTFEEFESDENFIAISITDPKSEKVSPPSDELFVMLSLQFHDVDKPLVPRDKCTACKGTGYLPEYKNINDGHCYRCTTMLDIKLFTDQEAKRILNFVDKYGKEVDLLVVHCEAGISRSAGVAGALSLIYNGSDEYYFKEYLPNMLVYRKILNAYMKNKKENLC